MNMQQVGQPRSSSDRYGHHKIGRDAASRYDSKYQTGSRTNFGKCSCLLAFCLSITG